MAKQNVIKTLTTKQRFETTEEATEEMINMQSAQYKLERIEQKKREELTAQAYRMMGRIEGADLIAKFGNVSALLWLQKIKESKIYRDVPGVNSWETFCNKTGKSRRVVDEQLQNLKVLGEDFLATVASFAVGYRELRKLRYAVSEGALIVEGEYVVIGDEKILMIPDNSEDLQAAIESIIDERDRKISDQESKIKAKDRVLEEKERVIQKQEKDLDKMTRQIKARGFEPGEENFIKDMENQKLIITGLLLKMDTQNMPEPEDMTPLMRAAYIETLGHGLRTFHAYYDTATTFYGIGDIDDAWVPPHRRPENAAAEAEPVNEDEIEFPEGCIQCKHHRSMVNKASGVKIPGEYGKCIREGGLCDIKTFNVQG